MSARWYDSGSGRFLSRDSVQPPIQGGADTNLYAYGRANLLVNSDPSGNFAFVIVPVVVTAPEWGPVVVGGAILVVGAIVAAASAIAIHHFTDSGSSTQVSSAAGARAVDRWWEDTSASSIDTTRSGTDTPTPREFGGGGRPGSAGAARAAARSAVARVLTYLPAPALAMNLGSGHLYLPTGARVPTGLTSLPGATPWVPQNTGCHACAELKSDGSGATSVPFGAFAQSATGDPCGMGLSMLALRPRVCLNNGKSTVEGMQDLACTTLQATLSDPNLAGVVGAICMMSSSGGGEAATADGLADWFVTRFAVPSSWKLGRNMQKEGMVRSWGEHAHHIVPGLHPLAASARRILEREGIGINDADNGVFLPPDTHLRMHTLKYILEVNARLRGAQGQAREVLRQIRREILQGGFPM